MLLRFTLSRTVRTLLIAAAVGMCLAPLRAQDTKATVLTQIGRVSVMTDALGYVEQPLFQGMTVSPQQLIVTGPDGYAQFRVSDGSTFEVFSNARVMFRPTMGNWKDLLNIVLGRVKVFIQHAPGQINHNEVSSPTAVISVRGTVFDVVVEDGDGTTLVSVDEGLVTVKHRTVAGNPVSVNPGESIRVFKDQALAVVKPDKSNAIQFVLKSAREAIWQVLRGQRPGGVAGVPAPGAQGDNSKGGNTGNTGKGGTTVPGAPSTPPGAPSTPPGAPPPGGD
jgi:hypothetical protein